MLLALRVYKVRLLGGVDKGPATCVVGCWKPHNYLWVALVPRPWGTDTGLAKYGGMIKDVQDAFCGGWKTQICLCGAPLFEGCAGAIWEAAKTLWLCGNVNLMALGDGQRTCMMHLGGLENAFGFAGNLI